MRAFELAALLLWLAGIAYVRRHPNPVYIGAYIGSSTLALFDWAFNSKWFFNVAYDSAFVPLWRISGQVQPVALCMTYAFYFGGPLLVAVHNRDRIDRTLGRWGWLVIFVASGLVNPLFEIPLVHWLHLWTYYQRPPFLLGGVAWSNIWFSGLLFTGCYGAVRLVLRWTAAAAPALSGREVRLRAMSFGTVAVWAAFYLCMQAQLVWYAVAHPWSAGPRPF